MANSTGPVMPDSCRSGDFTRDDGVLGFSVIKWFLQQRALIASKTANSIRILEHGREPHDHRRHANAKALRD